MGIGGDNAASRNERIGISPAKNAKVAEKNDYFFVFYAFFVVSPSDRKSAQAGNTKTPARRAATKVKENFDRKERKGRKGRRLRG